MEGVGVGSLWPLVGGAVQAGSERRTQLYGPLSRSSAQAPNSQSSVMARVTGESKTEVALGSVDTLVATTSSLPPPAFPG